MGVLPFKGGVLLLLTEESSDGCEDTAGLLEIEMLVACEDASGLIVKDLEATPESRCSSSRGAVREGGSNSCTDPLDMPAYAEGSSRIAGCSQESIAPRFAATLPSDSEVVACDPLDEVCEGCLRLCRGSMEGLLTCLPFTLMSLTFTLKSMLPMLLACCLRFALDERCEPGAC